MFAEVHSSYSPNHPAAENDFGAIAARRQGELASVLCPFKLVYDDGTEYLGCDSARERVRWVNAIWNVLDTCRAAPRRAPSIHSGVSRSSGSASTRFETTQAPASGQILPTQRMPRESSDDSFVLTAAGNMASLLSRDSHRLAAGVQRNRSLRRVASDADLREASISSSPSFLTREAATSRGSPPRDFHFAHGIAPPPLLSPEISSPPSFRHSAPNAATSFSSLSDLPVGQSEPAVSVAPSTPAPQSTTTTEDVFASVAAARSQPGRASSGDRTPRALMSPPLVSPPFLHGSPSPSYHTFGTPGLLPSDSISNVNFGQRDVAVPVLRDTMSPITEIRQAEAPPMSNLQNSSVESFDTAKQSVTSDSVSSTSYRTPAGSTPTSVVSPSSLLSPASGSSQTMSLPTSSTASPPASSTQQAPSTPRSAVTLRTALRAGPGASGLSHSSGGSSAGGSSVPSNPSLADYSGYIGAPTVPPPPSHRVESEPARYQLYDPPMSSSSTPASSSFQTARKSPYGTSTAADSMYSAAQYATPGPGTEFSTDGSSLAAMDRPVSDTKSSVFGTPRTVKAPYDYFNEAASGSNRQPPHPAFAAPPSYTASQPPTTVYTALNSMGSLQPGEFAPTASSRSSAFHTAGLSAATTSAYDTPQSGPSTVTRGAASTAGPHDTSSMVSGPSLYSSAPPVPVSRSNSSGASSNRPLLQRRSAYSTVSSAAAPSMYSSAPPIPISHDGSSRYTTSEAGVSGVSSTSRPPPPSSSSSSSGGGSSFFSPTPQNRSAASSSNYATASSNQYGTPEAYTSGLSNRFTLASDPSTFPDMSGHSATVVSGRSATPVSEPDTNESLFAALERQSTVGSYLSQTARRAAQSPYMTAGDYSSYQTPATPYTTAERGTASFATAPSAWSSATESVAPESLGPPPSSHRAIPRKAVPAFAPAPSEPPSSSSSSDPTTSSSEDPTTTEDTQSTTTYRTTSVSTVQPPRVPDGRDFTMLRLVNYLQGQEQVRQGQTTRMGSQMDRIEHKVDRLERIEAKISKLADRELPPPVPNKDRELDEDRPPSPALSDSSISSDETERPVTPPPVVIPDAIHRRLDDMGELLGKVLGQQSDILGQLADIQMTRAATPPPVDLSHMENMLRVIFDELTGLPNSYPTPAQPVQQMRSVTPAVTDVDSQTEGPWFEGAGSTYSFDDHVHAPPPSSAPHSPHASSFVADSLLEAPLQYEHFDLQTAMDTLPSPAQAQQYQHTEMPPWLVQRIAQAHGQQAPSEYTAMDYDEDYPQTREVPVTTMADPGKAPSPEKQPAPMPDNVQYYNLAPDSLDQDRALVSDQRPATRMPPPANVDLPTPINDKRHRDLYDDVPPPPPSKYQYPHDMRAMPPPMGPYPPTMGPMGPMGPPFMSRRGTSRFGSIRTPMSSTYFRRGIAPMVPGVPMFNPGLGVNMMPGMPGFMPGPLGMPGGLPMPMPVMMPPPQSHFGHGSESTAHALDSGTELTNTPRSIASSKRSVVSSSSSSSTGSSHTHTESTPPATTSPHSGKDEQLLTPVVREITFNTAAPPAPAITINPPQSEKGSPPGTPGTDYWRTRVLGEQQNDMARYLHGMSDQLTDMSDGVSRELQDILGQINTLRRDLHRERVHGQVLSDGTVQLSTGEIVDGIRGAPSKSSVPAIHVTPSTPRVEAEILSDGTVLAGNRVVEGIRAPPKDDASLSDLANLAKHHKDDEQDEKLAKLSDKSKWRCHKGSRDKVHH